MAFDLQFSIVDTWFCVTIVDTVLLLLKQRESEDIKSVILCSYCWYATFFFLTSRRYYLSSIIIDI